MAVLVLATSAFVEQQRAALVALAPGERIYTNPDVAPPGEIEALLAFRLAAGIAPRFPALRLIACAGAGVDDLLSTPDVPAHVPIVRAVDPLQGQRMAQYVAMMVLRVQRELPRLEMQHAQARWERFAPAPEEECTVGVMGHGAMGAPVVDILAQLGFPVVVWTRSPRHVESARSCCGPDDLAPFLAQSRILVCALPLTGHTRGLLAASTLALLPRGAYLVNVSRGAVLDEADLVAAVDAGHLSGAALDVFATEPLPVSSPLWRHPKLLCTPHVAATPRPDVAARQFLDNLSRARAGLPLVNLVDRTRGY